jgi:hypothetical protein
VRNFTFASNGKLFYFGIGRKFREMGVLKEAKLGDKFSVGF